MATIRTHRTARMNSSKSDEISGYYETVIIPNSKFQILYDVWIFLLPLINHQASNQASSFKLSSFRSLVHTGTYHTAGMYICSASLGARGRRGRPACWQTGKGVFIKISATVVSWMY
jgi:hypothetical protein